MKSTTDIRQGLLRTYNLWGLWDDLGENQQKKIVEYFKSKPLMWDYNDLFYGNKGGSVTHGCIDLLTTIFVLDDMEFCDILFNKFKTYTPENYANNSEWGNNWQANINHIREIVPQNDKYNIIYSTDIYWVDFHFFLHIYSKAVYRNFLKGNCSINRFENAVELDIFNIDKIKMAYTKINDWDPPPRNGIIDQYLIYLEKQKKYDDCINLINKMKDKGWRNDFEKRLDRCISKRIKLVR